MGIGSASGVDIGAVAGGVVKSGATSSVSLTSSGEVSGVPPTAGAVLAGRGN